MGLMFNDENLAPCKTNYRKSTHPFKLVMARMRVNSLGAAAIIRIDVPEAKGSRPLSNGWIHVSGPEIQPFGRVSGN